MELTYNQYIANPMGYKNSVISNREMYRILYTEKLNKILLREVGKVNYLTYKNKDKYYLYIKIPSEVIPKFYYDVVIEFYPNSKVDIISNSLKGYNVKFFSNDPSFVFTFAHAMLSNDLFIRDLIPRMSKEAVKKVAKDKNPKKEVGYVKSIYFTYLIMNTYNLFDKSIFGNNIDKYDIRTLLKLITHSDTKITDRQRIAKEISYEKKLDKEKIKTNNIKINTRNSSISGVNQIKNIKSSKNIGVNNKGVSTIKKVKKI